MSLGVTRVKAILNKKNRRLSMCEFCTQHGEGEKWYLTMENYSKDLLDQNKRREYAAEFLNGFDKRVPKSIKQLDKIRRTPLMKLAKPVFGWSRRCSQCTWPLALPCNVSALQCPGQRRQRFLAAAPQTLHRQSAPANPARAKSLGCQQRTPPTPCLLPGARGYR